MLDLGFEELTAATDSCCSNVAPATNWVCDWIVLSLIDQITPVCDATMYKFYAKNLDIDINSFDDSELTELASAYRKQIEVFQIDKLKERIYEVYNRWVSFVDRGIVTPRLPSNARKALLNFLMIIKNTTDTDLTPAFMNFYATLAEAHTYRTTNTYDAPDVFELINKDSFHIYCDIVAKILEHAFAPVEEEFDMSKFLERLKAAKAAIKAIMWMCDVHFESSGYEVDSLYEKIIRPELKTNEKFIEVLAKYDTRRSAPIAFALMMCPCSVELIPEDKDNYPRTDTYILATTLFYQKSLCKE